MTIGILNSKQESTGLEVSQGWSDSLRTQPPSAPLWTLGMTTQLNLPWEPASTTAYIVLFQHSHPCVCPSYMKHSWSEWPATWAEMIRHGFHVYPVKDHGFCLGSSVAQLCPLSDHSLWGKSAFISRGRTGRIWQRSHGDELWPLASG